MDIFGQQDGQAGDQGGQQSRRWQQDNSHGQRGRAPRPARQPAVRNRHAAEITPQRHKRQCRPHSKNRRFGIGQNIPELHAHGNGKVETGEQEKKKLSAGFS